MDDQVALNWPTVRKAMQNTPGNDIWLALRSRGNSLEEFAEAIEAVTRSFERSYPESSLLAESALRSPAGYLVKLTDVDADETVQSWCNAFAAELTRRGFTGKLTWAPSAKTPPWMADGRRTHAAFVDYVIDLAALTANQGRNTQWFVRPDADERITAAVGQWAYLSDAVQVLRLNGYLIAGEFESIAHELRRPPNTGLGIGVQYRRKADHRANVAYLNRVGGAVFQVYDEDDDWRLRIDHLREALTAVPADTNQAYIRPVVTPTVTHIEIDESQGLPGITEADVRYNRHLLDRYLPDAHGIQLVTSAHLANAHDLSGWDITDLPCGRHLVQARDLTPWYSTPLPDPSVVDKARADFAGALITKEIVNDNPTPW